MKNSIVFLCPYFGALKKDQLSLWLKSCATNSSIDFILFVDDEGVFKLDIPVNVRLIKMSWDECKILLQSHFDFKLSLVYPYKLCDYKPAFGCVFAEYVRCYDFWGHLDVSDTILGDLRKFITEQMLDSYDKIHAYGHMSLYRNNAENNERFRIPSSSGLSFRELYVREEVTGFDEMYHPYSINTIFTENGFPVACEIENLVADVLPRSWNFALYQDKQKYIPRVFEWNNGKLCELTVSDGNIIEREIGYVHFQKRNVENHTISNTNHFCFVPNAFVDADDELSADIISEYSKSKVYLDPLIGRVKRYSWYARHPAAFKRKLLSKIKK